MFSLSNMNHVMITTIIKTCRDATWLIRQATMMIIDSTQDLAAVKRFSAVSPQPGLCSGYAALRPHEARKRPLQVLSNELIVSPNLERLAHHRHQRGIARVARSDRGVAHKAAQADAMDGRALKAPLERILVHLQHYALCKVMSADVENMLSDALESLRPGLVLLATYSDACEALAALESGVHAGAADCNEDFTHSRLRNLTEKSRE